MGIFACIYRSTPGFVIRDETSKVIRKAWRYHETDRVQPLRETSPKRDMIAHIPQYVPLPLEATAVNYFFSVFSRSGTFAYLPEFASCLTADNKILPVLCASALGSMAVQYNDDKLFYSARYYYAISLRQTNRDLSEPKTAILDCTLLCVLLLSAFEAFAFYDGGNPRHWTAHIQGSSNLLLIRGKTQLESYFGRLLFHHAGVNILVNSINHYIPISLDLQQLFEYATASSLVADSISEKIMLLLCQMAQLAPNMTYLTFDEVVRETLHLDGQAVVFQQELEEMAPFEVLDVDNLDNEVWSTQVIHTFEGVMHNYQDQQIARLYNTARLMRLSLRQWMFVALCDRATSESAIDSSDVPKIPDITIERILAESDVLVRDMLASVPYSLELLDYQTSTEARYLIWPLTNVASLEVCPLPAKRYILDRLLALADKFHLRRALQAAELLSRREHEEIG